MNNPQNKRKAKRKEKKRRKLQDDDGYYEGSRRHRPQAYSPSEDGEYYIHLNNDGLFCKS